MFSRIKPIPVIGALLCAASLTAGCAFTPAPALLANKPNLEELLPDKNLKLALIVRDSRPDTVQECKLCGTKRNTYMIPTSFAFLAHREKLDEILAMHLKTILERAGYEIIGTVPQAPHKLSEDTLTKPPSSEKEAVEVARKSLRKEATPEDIPETGNLKVLDEFENRDDEEPPWTGVTWAKNADAILDLKIKSFNSDGLQGFAFVSIQGWCKATLCICDPQPKQRRVIWGQTYNGFGTSGPRAVITDDCYTCALDMAYWILLDGIEKEVRSDEFEHRIRQLKANR